MMNRIIVALVAAITPLAAFAFVAPVHTTSFTAAASGGRVAHVSRIGAATGEQQAKATPFMAMERSYIMVKPDGVQRGIVGQIITRFEQRGYKLAGLKLKQADEALLKQHYKDLVDKPFFPKMMEYMISGPVVCMAWEGKDVVRMGRKMLGATNPLESEPGTIRGDFSLEVGRNICHGSDSIENAERELGLWFDEVDIIDHESAMVDWIYE